MASTNEVNSTVENRSAPGLEVENGAKDEDAEEEDEREDSADRKASTSARKDSTAKSAVKLGHLRVGEDGQTMYKKTPSSAIMAAIQLGIGYSVGRLASKPERDVLMVDFSFVEKVWFPGSGSRETPSHKFSDFRFKSYAPVAFRYFRDLFGIQPSDFLMSLSHEEVREVGNPGASGSLFFLSKDDMFIVKTVQHKEAVFLQQLLPGYYMNLHQNPRTSLPKFFGLYCYQSGSTNIRLAVMNNLLPSRFKYHQKYDLKGSTFKRRANKSELAKKSPTRKDLDFLSDHPEGILLEAETYDAVMKTIMRDCRVLESFKIMDYSLLLGIHNLDQAVKDKALNSPYPSADGLNENPERLARRDEFSAALEAIQIDREEGRPVGGVPGKNSKGERLILFIGVIDILQSYRLGKKLEHGWKSFLHDGDTVSVHKPSFYAKRFLDFMGNKVFRRMPTVTRGPSKRRAGPRQGNTPYRGKSSVVEAPGSRLGDDMVPPPYDVSETPAASTSITDSPEQPGHHVQISTGTKIVKFNVDEGEPEGKEEESKEHPITVKIDEPSENRVAVENTEEVVEVSKTTETVTTIKTVSVTETEPVVTSAPVNIVISEGTASDRTDHSKESTEESTTTDTKQKVESTTEEPTATDVEQKVESTTTVIKNGSEGITLGGYEVTIVKEVRTVGPDGEEHLTRTTVTEIEPSTESKMKESGSSEFVVIENSPALVANDTSVITEIVESKITERDMENQGIDEQESSTSKL